MELKAPAIFFADCHLPLIPQPGQEKWAERVIRFLRTKAREAETLVIAGDLLDFWFEWRHSIPAAAFPVLAELYNLAERGCDVIYMAGNHDGHPGAFLRRRVGLRVFRDPVDAEIAGKRFHIVHGDGIAPADRGYRMLRALVRWGPTEAIYKLVHPDFGIWFAHLVSRWSNASSSRRDRFGPEPYRQYARNKLQEGFDYVIMGHRHKTDEFTSDLGQYICIGDWIRDGAYAVFDGTELKLQYFNK